MRMDFPSSSVIVKLEPSSQLSEPEGDPPYRDSRNIVQTLACSLSSSSSPSTLAAKQKEQERERTSQPCYSFTRHDVAADREVGEKMEKEAMKEEIEEHELGEMIETVIDGREMAGERESTKEGREEVESGEETSGEERDMIENEQPMAEEHGEGIDQETISIFPIDNQVAEVIVYTASAMVDVDSSNLENSHNPSQQPGPSNWSDSQRSVAESDALYSSQSQPPSLKVLELDSPSSSPAALSPDLVDSQPTQEQELENGEGTEDVSLSSLVTMMDGKSPPWNQLPGVTKDSPLSGLLTMMDFISPLPSAKSTPLSPIREAPTCAQSPEKRPPKPLRDVTKEDVEEMDCSSSGSSLPNPSTRSEKERGRGKEGERGVTTEPYIRGRSQEPREKVLNGGRCERFDRNGASGLLNLFRKSGDFFKEAVQSAYWGHCNDSSSKGQKACSKGQRSRVEGQSSHPICYCSKQPSASSDQRVADDHTSKEQDGDGAITDECGTLEVDVEGGASQQGTLEVDIEGTPSDDEMEIEGASPSNAGPVTSQIQVQQSKDVGHKTVDGVRENLEKPRPKLSLTIDKSKRMERKVDTTGNVTMPTPHHSQPPYQPNQKSPELYSQEYLHPSTTAVPSGSNTSTTATCVSSSSTNTAPTASRDLFTSNDGVGTSLSENLAQPMGGKRSQDLSIPSDPSKKSPLESMELFTPSDPSSREAPSRTRRKSPTTEGSPTERKEHSSSSLTKKESSLKIDDREESPYKSVELFAPSKVSLSAIPANVKRNSPTTRTICTRSKKSLSGGPTVNTTLPKVAGGPSVVAELGEHSCSPSPSHSASLGKGHSQNPTPSSLTRETVPNRRKPRVRGVDPVYHNDPQLERWRQLMQAHWFEVKMIKSRQPLSKAERESLIRLGLADNQ